MDNKSADQPLHKGMGPRNVGHGLDFGDGQDSQVGLPAMRTIKRIVVGTEVLRHGAVASKGVVEHSAKGHPVDRAGVQAKSNDPTSVLIHDDQYPVSSQDCRFAAKEVDAPETVLQVTEESQPGRTTAVCLGSVMSGQNAPNHVFIHGDAECPSNLLGDSRTAPGEITLFGGDNGVNEVLRGTLGTGFAPDFRGEEQAVLALSEDLVKVQEGRRLYHDGRTDPPGRPYKQSAPAGDEPIREAEVGSAVAGAIEDQQLMFDEEGLGKYGTDAARTRQSGEGGDEMDEKDHEIAHFRILATKPKLAEFRANWQFAMVWNGLQHCGHHCVPPSFMLASNGPKPCAPHWRLSPHTHA
jgi:hypothetical protein